MQFFFYPPTPGVDVRTQIKQGDFADFVKLGGQFNVISTDVFDTLLLRNSRSERSRIIAGERLFSDFLIQQGWQIDADILVAARLQAQKLAFRGLALREGAGEARLVDIVNRQLSVLGLPETFVSERIQIEIEIEKTSLVANEVLARSLRSCRNAGARIIAISDTTLPAYGVAELIQQFHGTGLIDHVYSSADHGSTKRGGGLFLAVARAENVSLSQIFHVGDDLLADVQTPSAKGISACHSPRRSYHRYLRVANGALIEAGRLARSRARTAQVMKPFDDTAVSFGRYVFGPIVTQFCLLIWLYAVEAETGDKPCLLFCARGGVGIREMFERVLAKLCLPLNTRRENIMISRLVAARAALLAGSQSAIEELGREFRGSVFADVASALGGKTYKLAEEWQQPFDGPSFLALLNGESGAEIRADIEQQNALFTRHFKQLIGDSNRIILCDTGLYGSTQRLLASGFPDLCLETIQFARSNYKGHGEEHFPKVAGLIVERNRYTPFNVYSCVLRYWHLIESLFEPAVPSVRLFMEDALGEVKANCGDISFGVVDPSLKNPLLAGALAYVDVLPIRGGAVAIRDAEAAWYRLKHAITWPTEAQLRCLDVGGRSVDFGRPDIRQIFTAGQNKILARKLKSLKGQLWREGAIAREFPVLKYALLPVLGAVQTLRGLLARQH